MKKNEHLPFHVIVSASEGDKQAIQKVLKHYDGYISKQCLRPLYDEYGQVHMVVDSEMKGRIQSAVMKMVQRFEITVI